MFLRDGFRDGADKEFAAESEFGSIVLEQLQIIQGLDGGRERH